MNTIMMSKDVTNEQLAEYIIRYEDTGMKFLAETDSKKREEYRGNHIGLGLMIAGILLTQYRLGKNEFVFPPVQERSRLDV